MPACELPVITRPPRCRQHLPQLVGAQGHLTKHVIPPWHHLQASSLASPEPMPAVRPSRCRWNTFAHRLLLVELLSYMLWLSSFMVFALLFQVRACGVLAVRVALAARHYHCCHTFGYNACALDILGQELGTSACP